jgi:hypothetical protein
MTVFYGWNIGFYFNPLSKLKSLKMYRRLKRINCFETKAGSPGSVRQRRVTIRQGPEAKPAVVYR